jgi:SAM-dependent methyltransferase
VDDLLQKHLDQMERDSRALSPEAVTYWLRHKVRYAYMARLLAEQGGGRQFGRILDVGMGFETLLLRRCFPSAAIDCLGVYHDERYNPGGEHNYYEFDLNLAGDPSKSYPGPKGCYDAIVFMEVLEHLIIPPDAVLRLLSDLLAPGGLLLLTTPNGAWLKNRLKLLRGVNPFERLRSNPNDRGHIREYTKGELEACIRGAGLSIRQFDRRGLYTFDNRKDNFYSFVADHTHTSLSRTLAVVCSKS